MPLSITKIAFGAESVASLKAWLESHAGEGEARLTTRYLPKRADEMAGGSLYWILGGVFIGRSPLLGFAERPDRKIWIRLEPRLVPVEARPRRAHQGWRYLEEADAPRDISVGEGDALPAALASELAKLGLI
jgi:hypothetical protein